MPSPPSPAHTPRQVFRSLMFAVPAALVLAAGLAHAADLHVPSQYPTIQAAVNAAQHGDTVIIADGAFRGIGNRNINLGGKRITVRSQNGARATTIDAERNGSVFILNSGETDQSIIEGLTIRGATQSGVRITGPSASPPTAPIIRDCIITDNWNGALGGGAVYVENGGNVTIIDSVLHANLASQGGGVLLWQNARATILRTTISNNRVDLAGGGAVMADQNCRLTMDACIIVENQAIGFVGSSAGVRIARDSTAVITNSLFHNNTAATTGAAISFTNTSSGRVINCTVADNVAQSGAGLLLTSGGVGTVEVTNTIFWNNFPDQILHQGGNLEVSYTLVQSGWPGTGNITGDPIFIDPASGNYQPAATHTVDAGDNTALPPTITTDLLGNPRFVAVSSVPNTGVPGGTGGSAIVDLGAYELQFEGCYPNCDGSTGEPILTVDDFTCFINEFAAAQALPHEQQITHYANCDGSTTAPVLTVDDFTCFIDAFAGGCP